MQEFEEKYPNNGLNRDDESRYVKFDESRFRRVGENLSKKAKRKNLSPKMVKDALRSAEALETNVKETRKQVSRKIKNVRRIAELEGKSKKPISKVMKIGKRIGDLLKRKSILKKTFPVKFKGGVVIPTKTLKRRFKDTGKKPEGA